MVNKDEILFITKGMKLFKLCKKAFRIGESIIKSVKTHKPALQLSQKEKYCIAMQPFR